MYNAPRAASIKANTNCVLWALDRDSFNYYIKNAAVRRRELLIEFINTVDIFSTLDEFEIHRMVDCFNKEVYPANTNIITQGEEGDKFYILKEGNAEAWINDKKVLD